MAKIIVCKDCVEEKEHYAKRLCSACYKHQQHYSRGNSCVSCAKSITNNATRCNSCANRFFNRSSRPNHKRENNPNWKGGKRETPEGRVLLYTPDNPMSDSRGYVRRSRLVMAEDIGRPLEKEERVHHINRDVGDDRPENLILFKNESEHQRYHSLIRRIKKRLGELLFRKDLPEDDIPVAMSFLPLGQIACGKMCSSQTQSCVAELTL